jgi:transcription termination factor 2
MLEDEDVDEDSTFDEDLEEHIISKRNPVFDDFYESAKIKRILEDLEHIRQQAKQEERPMDKVVIVSSWTSLLEIINHHLRERKFSSVFITGKEGAEERRDAQKAFNKGEKRPQIALLSLKAGGVGINLVGGNHVFFVEPHWNPQMELQAQDRVHRFGQEKDVFIRRYITTGSIEDRILDLQQMKKDLADGVLNSNKKKGAKGGGLSVEQMKHLFEVYNDK